MAIKEYDSRIHTVKNSVTIPQYFYNLIIPQVSSYYSDYMVDFDSKPVCKCPIHDEDTPSMRYYEETNTFYCFGCRAGGDVIELHRQFTAKMIGQMPSFDESIDFLYNYFIRGLEGAKIVKSNKAQSKQVELSTVTDMVRYNKYVSTLEQQILMDSSIKEETKEIIWRALDNVHLLTSLNKISSIDGVAYIKNIVKESIR